MLKYIFLLLLATSALFTQQDEVVTIKKSDLPTGVYEQIQNKQQIAKYGEWVGLGKEIGAAFDGALGSIQTHAQELADSRLGGFIMFLVAYKVIGHDMIRIFSGGGIFLITIILLSWSYRKTCITRRIKIQGGKEPKWEIVDPTEGSSTIDARRGTHALLLFISIGMCALIAFA